MATSSKDSRYGKARKYYSDGKYQDAIYWYTMAISVDDKDAELYSERGVAFFHIGKLAESLQDMNQARDLEPNNPYRYASRAYIRDAMGDVEGAVKDYRQAIFLDPEDAVAHNNLGLLEEKLGRKGNAQALFDLADKLAKDDPAFGISGSSTSVHSRPVNLQREIDKEKKSRSLWREAAAVFRSRQTFSEFITFVRKGFK